jgi:hypothetical protein
MNPLHHGLGYDQNPYPMSSQGWNSNSNNSFVPAPGQRPHPLSNAPLSARQNPHQSQQFQPQPHPQAPQPQQQNNHTYYQQPQVNNNFSNNFNHSHVMPQQPPQAHPTTSRGPPPPLALLSARGDWPSSSGQPSPRLIDRRKASLDHVPWDSVPPATARGASSPGRRRWSLSKSPSLGGARAASPNPAAPQSRKHQPVRGTTPNPVQQQQQQQQQQNLQPPPAFVAAAVPPKTFEFQAEGGAKVVPVVKPKPKSPRKTPSRVGRRSSRLSTDEEVDFDLPEGPPDDVFVMTEERMVKRNKVDASLRAELDQAGHNAPHTTSDSENAAETVVTLSEDEEDAADARREVEAGNDADSNRDREHSDSSYAVNPHNVSGANATVANNSADQTLDLSAFGVHGVSASTHAAAPPPPPVGSGAKRSGGDPTSPSQARAAGRVSPLRRLSLDRARGAAPPLSPKHAAAPAAQPDFAAAAAVAAPPVEPAHEADAEVLRLTAALGEHEKRFREQEAKAAQTELEVTQLRESLSRLAEELERKVKTSLESHGSKQVRVLTNLESSIDKLSQRLELATESQLQRLSPSAAMPATAAAADANLGAATTSSNNVPPAPAAEISHLQEVLLRTSSLPFEAGQRPQRYSPGRRNSVEARRAANERRSSFSKDASPLRQRSLAEDYQQQQQQQSHHHAQAPPTSALVVVPVSFGSSAIPADSEEQYWRLRQDSLASAACSSSSADPNRQSPFRRRRIEASPRRGREAALAASASAAVHQFTQQRLSGGGGAVGGGHSARVTEVLRHEVLSSVLIRPFVPEEQLRGDRNVLELTPEGYLCLKNPFRKGDRRLFSSFFRVYDSSPLADRVTASPVFATPEVVASDLGAQVQHHILAGYDAAVFSYGHVDAGRAFKVVGRPWETSFVLAMVTNLLDAVAVETAATPYVSFSIEVSVLEIHQNHVRDLLADPTAPGAEEGLKIRESTNKKVFFTGKVSDPVERPEDLHQTLARAYKHHLEIAHLSAAHRAASEASHRVVEVQLRSNDTRRGTATLSKLLLCELAAFSRPEITKSMSQRPKESSAAVNSSLSTLGNCLHDMALGRKLNQPRSSVLTRLLSNQYLKQASLTYFVSCISPSSRMFDDTLATLRFSERVQGCESK